MLVIALTATLCANVFINGAANNTIGGASPGAGNLVSGNAVHAVTVVGGTGNVVQGNLIGTDITGTAQLGNVGIGLDIVSAFNTTIGGTGAARNVISGNGTGIQIRTGATGNVVQGNLIGTDVTGNVIIPNGSSGVHRRGFSTGTRSGAPGGPERAVASPPPGLETATWTRLLSVPETLGVMVKPVRSEVMSSLSMCAVRTGSIHTVCQMPDDPV